MASRRAIISSSTSATSSTLVDSNSGLKLMSGEDWGRNWELSTASSCMVSHSNSSPLIGSSDIIEILAEKRTVAVAPQSIELLAELGQELGSSSTDGFLASRLKSSKNSSTSPDNPELERFKDSELEMGLSLLDI